MKPDPIPKNIETPDDRPLPPGWRRARLGEVCEDRTGIRDPRREPDKPLRYVDITSVDNIIKRIISPKTILGKEAPSRARQVIRVGDVIVSTTRPNLNAVAMVPLDLDDQICSTGFCVLRADHNLDRDYLFAFVQTQEFVQGLSELVRGALYPAVTDNQVKDQLIPLPPLSEQQRIAAILNEQMAAVERARAAAGARLEAAKALPAAYLRTVFNSPLAQKWPRMRLGEICEITARQVDPKVPEFGNLPHINGENIEGGMCRLTYLKTAAENGMVSSKYLFEPDDVLYSKLRPYLRKAVVADFRGVCSADMYPIRVNQQVLDPHFTAWMLVSDEFSKYADEESRRARMPKLNREQLFAWKIPMPSISEQRRLISMVSNRITLVRRTQRALEEELAAINALPAALLRRAFNGDL